MKLLFVICSLFLVGCVRSQAINFETSQRPERPIDHPIEIIEKDQIKRAYKVIGIVRVNVGKLADPSSAINRLREEARKMGGDALIEIGIEDGRSGVIVPLGNVSTFGSTRVNYAAKVIVFEDK